jgi:hypothetical protein
LSVSSERGSFVVGVQPIAFRLAGGRGRQALVIVGATLAALSLSACGHTTTERAATGALAGLVVAGPVGAVVGAGAGVVVSKSQHDR